MQVGREPGGLHQQWQEQSPGPAGSLPTERQLGAGREPWCPDWTCSGAWQYSCQGSRWLHVQPGWHRRH